MLPVRILIVGTGFGGVYTLKKLHDRFHRDSRVRLSIVGEKNYFLFAPLLHEVATGGISPENIAEPVRGMFECCLYDFHTGRANLINLKERIVNAGDERVAFDYLVLAPGAETTYYNVPGAKEHSFSLKSLEDAIKIKNRIITQIEKASDVKDKEERKKMLRFVVVGGGPTGVELAVEVQEFIKNTFSRYYSKEIIEDASVVLIQKMPELLMQFAGKLRKKSLAFLEKKGIQVLLNTDVSEVSPSFVLVNKEKIIPAETTVWVAGIKPADIQFDEAVLKTEDGKVLVNEYLQLQDFPNIFALGDFSAFKQKDGNGFLPALAQVAVRQAETVAENIERLIDGKQPKKFNYRHKGDLISLGQWMAIGQIKGVSFWGRVVWLLWRTVYLSKIISWRKKTKVGLEWTINFFLPRDITKL